MSKITNAIWSGLRKRMSSMALTFTGRRVGIEEIPRETGELGYTSRGGGIHLSRDNDILDEMKTVEEQTAFIMGVFAHELMHQLITDFAEFEKTLGSMSHFTAGIFRDIYNVMEDPAIEEQAKYYIGGDLLTSLHYTVMTLYKKTGPLQKGHPMAQLMSALIMYGDGGFVKGRFYSRKAKKIFYKILPIVDKTIVEPKAKKRVEYAYQVFLMTKPLWEEDLKQAEQIEKLAEELRRCLSENGKKSSGFNNQSPVNPERNEGASDPIADKKQKRRKVTFRKVSKEELEALKKGGAAGEDDGVSDIEVLYTDDVPDNDDDAKDSVDVSVPSAKDQAEPGHEHTLPEECGGDETDSSANSETASKAESKDGAKADKTSADNVRSAASGLNEGESSCDGDCPNTAFEGSGVNGSDEEIIDDVEYELTSAEIARITEMLSEIKQDEAAAKNERDACHAEDLDVETLKSNYAGVKCLNKRIKHSPSADIESVYNRIIETFSVNINRLTNQMKRIINNDRGERIYRSCGKVHVPRLCGGRMTTNVFRRNIDPANKADMCVLLLADESASMRSQNKSICAMHCAVCLAEVLSRLHIPLKVIGFTADTGGYHVVHNHYMHWLNTREERLYLTSITHRANNFDGYSIRYATEMLKKRPEEHKLLIVLSDGQPAANYYQRGQGVADTTDAIKCAKKKVDVIGVGVGSGSENVWKVMYGNSFLHVKNANELLSQIGSEIQKIMKRW